MSDPYEELDLVMGSESERRAAQELAKLRAELADMEGKLQRVQAAAFSRDEEDEIAIAMAADATYIVSQLWH